MAGAGGTDQAGVAQGGEVPGLDQRLLDATPKPLLGRAMSVSSAGLMLTKGLGFAVAGVAAQALSALAVIAAAGIAGLTVVLVGVLFPGDFGRQSWEVGRCRPAAGGERGPEGA